MTPKTKSISGSAKRLQRIEPRQILDAMSGAIPTVRTGPAYRLGLVLVAIAMLVLPVVYVAILVALGFGVFLHAVHSVWILDQVHSRISLFLYVAPILMGLAAMAFMIKPLMARRSDDSVPLTLRREDEPVLLEFVERLCRMVGAPTPRRIDVDMSVNASASFRGGWTSLFGRDLVLTFGLPLAGGLDTRQFAGVLAHELGHFTQGSGMRLTYVIRRMNVWFARVVYQRDEWDVRLRAAAHEDHVGIMLIAWTTIAMVWLTRRVLWCLMIIGHGVSSFMLRQMEYNADCYECRIAGSDTFEKTSRDLRALGLATAAAFSDLGGAWRERRLCDDLPALIHSRQTNIPDELRNALRQHEPKQKTRWFDSHPCDADRLAAARRQNAKADMRPRAPAAMLFTNFPELSRIATMLYYKNVLGNAFRPGHLTQTQKLVTARAERQQTLDVMDVYFRGLVDPCRPVFPDRLQQKAPSETTIAEQLLDLRSKLLEAEPAAKEAAGQYDEASAKAATYAAARELRTAGFRKTGAEDAKVDAMSDDQLSEAFDESMQQRTGCLSIIDRTMQIAIERLNLALLLLRHREEAAKNATSTSEADEYALADEAPAGSIDALMGMLNAMNRVAADIQTLSSHGIALRVLIGRLKPAGNPQPLVDTVLWHGRKASDLLRELHQHFTHMKYPYTEKGRRLTICGFLIPSLPPPNAVGQVASSAASVIEGYRSLYMRAISDLSRRAVELESELGLPPLEAPAAAKKESEG